MLAITLVALSIFTGATANTDGGYGHVDFANSGSPSAQKDFLDGLALLHDSWVNSYSDAVGPTSHERSSNGPSHARRAAAFLQWESRRSRTDTDVKQRPLFH